MISFEECKEVFEDEVFAELISSYKVNSLDEIKEIIVKVEHDGGGGIYSELCDFHCYGAVSTLNGIENLKNLECLIFEYHEIEEIKLSSQMKLQFKRFGLHYFFSDYDLIEGMDNLEELCIGFINNHHLENISKLPNLKTLHLYSKNISNFSELDLLDQDCEVRLGLAGNLDNRVILGSSNLQRISINPQKEIDIDFKDLKDFENLEEICFSNCLILNADLLNSFNKLKEVTICSTTPAGAPIYLSEISSKPLLTNLNISNINSNSILIHGLPNIRILRIDGSENLNSIEINEIGKPWRVYLGGNNLHELKINNATLIHNLHITNSKIKDVDFLSQIKNSVHNIEIENCPIEDLSGLSECRSLERIYCSNAKLASLKPLYSLSNISINLSNNPSLNPDEIKHLVEINGCEVHCDIKYLEIIDPLRAIKDEVLKIKLENFIFEAREYKNFTYKPLSKVEGFSNFSHNTMNIPTRISSLSCFPGDIKTIEGIEILENLEHISIDFNKNHISLKPLAKLKKLKEIDFTQASIYDLESLLEIENLESLILWECCGESGFEEILKSLEQSGVNIQCQNMWWKELFKNIPSELRD